MMLSIQIKIGFVAWLLLSIVVKAQTQIIIQPSDTVSAQVLQTIPYKNQFKTLLNTHQQLQWIASQLYTLGYLEHTLIPSQPNMYQLTVGQQTQGIVVQTQHLSSRIHQLLQLPKDSLYIHMPLVSSTLDGFSKVLEQNGYPLHTVQLDSIEPSSNQLKGVLRVHIQSQRKVNELVIMGYDKFPKGYKRVFTQQLRKQWLTRTELDNIQKNFANLPFVSLTKPPEILFTTDSTKVFVYVTPKSNNVFEGFVGFANTENQPLKLTGNIHLLLLNAFHSGEKIQLNWSNNGKQQSDFSIASQLPYLFKTPLQADIELNIRKNDSIAQNSTFSMGLSYAFTQIIKAGIHYQTTQSTDLINTSQNSQSFTNRFYNFTFQGQQFDYSDGLFPEKYLWSIALGLGNRNGSEKQSLFQAKAFYHYTINSKNSVFVRSTLKYLQSKSYWANELFRFGGTETVRGFNDLLLQAHSFGTLQTEYRYRLARNLYINSVLDSGYFSDATQQLSGTVTGLGAGLGLQTNGGIMQFMYASGLFRSDTYNFNNSVVHIRYFSKF